MRFAVEPQFFDLGLTPYDRPVERDLHIANTGAAVAGAAECRQVCPLQRTNSWAVLGRLQCNHRQQLVCEHCWLPVHFCPAGKVPFDFTIDTSQLTRPGIIVASPSNGTVNGGQKAHVKLRVSVPLHQPTPTSTRAVPLARNCMPSYQTAAGCKQAECISRRVPQHTRPPPPPT